MPNRRKFLSGGASGTLNIVMKDTVCMAEVGKMKRVRLCAIIFAILLFNQFNPELYAEEKPT
ncbi:MAG: hypothetical protein Q6358_12590, partial [Candidatus Brocadiales bacterium]|nr:hypothetical protein [Candidatus Brocadiales bacterium]